MTAALALTPVEGMCPTRREPRPLAVLHGQLGNGGSERQLVLFLRECDRNEWSPRVYTGVAGPVLDELTELGIPVTVLGGGPISKMREFRAAVRRERPAAVVSWSSWTNVLLWTALAHSGPRIGSFRNAGFSDLPTRHRALWSWASRAHLTTIVCNSPETAHALRQRTRRSQRVLFVPNAVQPVADVARHRSEWRQRLAVADDEVLVMGIGRLGGQKAFDRFVDAVAYCHARFPVRGVILGPDYDGHWPELERHLQASGLDPEVVRYLGPVDNAREAVCAADVFLLSSSHEGMANVVLEAMAAGVPCVTTPVSGISSVVTSGVDGLVSEYAVECLGSALHQLVSDPARRAQMSAQARLRMARQHSPARVYRPLWRAISEESERHHCAAVRRYVRRSRAVDLGLCLLSLPVVVPIGLAAAAAVRVADGGPVLHHAARVGRGGRPFQLHKLRSMRSGTGGPGITSAHDPRVTPLGALLRRSKLDELPQIYNVLVGDMSLVGPRPEDPRYVDLSNPSQQALLAVRPGLTGAASVRFRHEEELLDGPDWEARYRRDVLPRKIELDLGYLGRPTLRGYASVLLRTVVALALPARGDSHPSSAS